MNTPLQKAAQAAIDHAYEFYVLYKRTVTSGCLPLDELKFVAAQKELRKALDAEIAQSVEPFAYFNIGTEYHVKGKIIFHKGLTPNLEDRWWGPDTPLYLHPPQPQATTPALRECWYESNELKVCRKCGQMHDKAIAAQGEKP